MPLSRTYGPGGWNPALPNQNITEQVVETDRGELIRETFDDRGRLTSSTKIPRPEIDPTPAPAQLLEGEDPDPDRRTPEDRELVKVPRWVAIAGWATAATATGAAVVQAVT